MEKKTDRKTSKKKLVLKRETLVVLNPDQLNHAVGGLFRCCGHGPVTSA